MNARLRATSFAFLCLGLLLPFASTTAFASNPNLQLVIQGPFVLCESGQNLLIAIPNLDGNHYTPGFTAERDGYAMGIPTGWGDLRYPQYAHYVLTIGSAGSGAMAVVSDGNGDPHGSLATLYREKGTCDDFVGKKSASVVVQVPKPDELWPLGGERAAITDAKPTSTGAAGTPHGLCTDIQTGCVHANKLVLRYLQVDLSSVKLVCDASGDCPTVASWTPTLVSVGNEAVLEYDVQPVLLSSGSSGSATSIPQACQQITPGLWPKKMSQEEAEAFCTTTTMAGRPRYVSHPGLFQMSADHRDCKAAVALICQGSVCP
jgi:hypothetical protein